jgi:2-oxoglutarate dehydrogenase E2 component (dihydrolipoamide succinyltransferase)
MSVSVELPALGESVVEGTVSKWLVKEGDFVDRDQPLVEVTTDKVDAEIPAPEAGVIVAIIVAEGDTIPVGAALCEIDPDAKGEVRNAAVPAAETQPALAPVTAVPPSADAPRATPVARRLAEQDGVDLVGIEGSGVAGRIMKGDVERAAAAAVSPVAAKDASARPTSPSQPPASLAYGAGQARPRRPSYMTYQLQEGDRVIKMTPLRKIVAEHMVLSKQTSPHVGTVAEVDMSGVVRFRNRHKGAFREKNGFNLTFLPFVVSATVRALLEFPRLNASIVDDSIIEKRRIHVGVAVETDKGLVVPVVRDADRFSLTGLAAAIEDLSTRARNKQLSPDDLQGGTFTVSNPGRFGNLHGFAIINQPQAGIVRMGEMVKRPVVRDAGGEDAIVIRPIMHVALSYDHRIVDGAPANGFLHHVREVLEEADYEL